MPHLLRLEVELPQLVPHPGNAVEYLRDGRAMVRSLCRLELNPDQPLSSRTAGFERLRPEPGEKAGTIAISPGVWECELNGLDRFGPRLWLIVDALAIRLVSRAEAFCALGAIAALEALDLHDAAVSLAAGDYDFASVQVIAERDRRKGQADRSG